MKSALPRDRGSSIRLLLARIPERWFLLFLVVAFAVLLVQTYSRANRPEGYDLNAYLFASQALLTGADPYVDGTFPYIYPLFLAFMITPLLALPLPVTHLVWFALNAFALTGSGRILAGFAFPESAPRFPWKALAPLTVLFVLFFDSIQNNFLNGQVNFVVLFLSLWFLREHIEGRYLRGAVALGAAIALKILPGILLFFLLLRGKVRAFLLTVFCTVVFFLLPWVVAENSLWTHYRTYVRTFLMASAFPGRVGGQVVFFSLSRFVSYVIPELADWSPLRILCAVLVVAGVSVALLTAKKTDLSSVSFFCVFLLAALLVSPKSDMHHLALLYPGAALLSLGWYRRGESVVPTLALAGFWVLYLTGTVWRTGPMMFLAIVALVFLLIRYPDEGAGKQLAP